MTLTHLYSPELREKQREPIWKDKVDRWYQLDENAFALCEALHAWALDLATSPHFGQIIFICEGGSNLADADFINTRPASPSKFVYTLVNIAPSVGLQLLNWRGPVTCYCVPIDNDSQPALIEKLAKAQALARPGFSTLMIRLRAGLNPDGYRVVTGSLIS